jgi:hypothetical protein
MTALDRADAADAPPHSAPWWAAAVRLVRFVLRRTFLDPVREGRLADTGWSPGLRAIVAIGIASYVVMMVAAASGTWLRRHAELVFAAPDQSLPVLTLPLIGVAAVVSLAALFAAGLHLSPPLRIAVTVVVVAALLDLVDWTQRSWVDWLTVALAGCLVLTLVLRWNRHFHWLEFVVGLVAIGHAVVAQVLRLVSPYGASNLQVFALDGLLALLWNLALPAALLAGAALIEITTAAATWTVAGLWNGIAHRRLAGPLGVVLLALLIGIRVAQEAVRISSPADPVRPRQVLLGLAIAVAILLAGGVVTWLADRTPAGDPARRPDLDDLLPIWSRWVPALALLLAAAIGLQLLVSRVVRAFGTTILAVAIANFGGASAVVWYATAGTLLAAAAGIWLAFRGRRTAALLLMAFAVMYGASVVSDTTGLLTTNEDVLAATTLLAVLLGGWLVARRRLTAESGTALGGVLLITVVYPYRSWVTEPATQLFGLAGVSAALLVGLVWRILTDNGYARGDSARFPQSSRVLLALANALVGATTIAVVALVGGFTALDLSVVESVGDHLLGFPLVLAATYAGLSLAARGRDATRRPRSGRRPTTATSPADSAARTA